MKVVISAGGRFHALHLARQLNRRNSLETLFTFDYQDKDKTFIPASKVNSITSCKVMNDWFLKLRMAKFLDKTRFNVFKDNLFDTQVSKQLSKTKPFDIFVGWAHYAKNSIQAARSAGAKIIIESGSCHIKTQQEILEEEYKKWGVPLAPIRQETIDKICDEYEMADYIMTLSSFARKSFLKHSFDENKILTVPCGIDVEYFEGSKHVLRTLEGDMSYNKFRVIFVGLITLRKGLQYLIQAWNKAKLPEQDTELIIVGAMQKDFAQIMHKLPIKKNITFVGSTSRKQLRDLYHNSSLFVLPSIEEGFGMVIGEAMASGLPVICSTSSGAPDIFNDGQSGFLVKPSDTHSLAEKIIWCYEHKQEACFMGQQGQNRIQNFSWDRYGEAVHKIYSKILKKDG